MFLENPKFARKLRISDFVAIEVSDTNLQTVFHFAFAEIMQERAPSRILFQVIRDALGKKNVTGISAIHYSLGDIDSSALEVGLLVQVSDLVDRPAVNP